MFTPPSVNQITKAYSNNPEPLARKVDQDKKQNGGIPKDLRQLLALNDIANNKNAMGVQQALQIPTNMPTVAQSLQQKAQQAIQARMMQQMQQQGQPNVIPEGVPKPRMQAQGLDALAANVGEGYATGGIIPGFTGEDGSVVIDPMLGTMQDTTPPKDDLTFFERIGVFNPENRRANEKREREARLREQSGGKKPEIERGRLRDPRASQFNIPDIETQVKEAALAAAEAEKKPSGQKTRVNAEEKPGIVAALPPAETAAYKKLTDMMNQDPEAKAKALRDRYLKEVGSRDLSIYDKTAAELEARKERLNAPKEGYDALMDYLENVIEAGGKDWQTAGSGGARLRKKKQLEREAQQDLLRDRILELGGKKAEAQYAEKKGMFDLTEKERDDVFKRAFDAAKSVNASDDEAKKLAAQAVENEKNRQNQIRSAQIGAQDRDNLMSRARALMAADPTKKMTLEQAMQRAGEIGAAGQMESAEVRRIKAFTDAKKEIDAKPRYIGMLLDKQNKPEYAKLRQEYLAEINAAKAMAGLSDQGINALLTSTGLPAGVTVTQVK